MDDQKLHIDVKSSMNIQSHSAELLPFVLLKS
jgi:hypothetical protein